MKMSEQQLPTLNKSQIDELTDELEAFKSMFQFPKLYLSNFFSELRNKIDVTFLTKINNELDYDIKDDLNENWIEIIHHINSFETECSSNQRTNKFNIQITKETNLEIVKIENLLANFKLDSYDLVQEMINEQAFKIKKLLFLNKTIVFLGENKYASLTKKFTKKFNTRTTAGILLIVSDEYINQNNITKVVSFDKLLTNEKIKQIHFKQILSISSFIVELNLQINTLKDLDFHKMRLKSISKSAFDGLTSLKKLCLENNQLTDLKSDTFKGLNNLKSLFLNDNSFQALEPKLFQDLKNIQELFLHTNQLVSIDPLTFKGLDQLVILTLDGNKITNIDKSTFDDLKCLKELCLSFNTITTIDSKAFIGLKNLEYLSLKNNSIKSIDKHLFKELKNLELLDLSSNCVASLDSVTFNGCSKLKCLWMECNKLTSIGENLFNGLKSLEELYLSNNLIKVIKPGAFDNLTNLKKLYLLSNPIEEMQPIRLDFRFLDFRMDTKVKGKKVTNSNICMIL